VVNGGECAAVLVDDCESLLYVSMKEVSSFYCFACFFLEDFATTGKRIINLTFNFRVPFKFAVIFSSNCILRATEENMCRHGAAVQWQMQVVAIAGQ